MTAFSFALRLALCVAALGAQSAGAQPQSPLPSPPGGSAAYAEAAWHAVMTGQDTRIRGTEYVLEVLPPYAVGPFAECREVILTSQSEPKSEALMAVMGCRLTAEVPGGARPFVWHVGFDLFGVLPILGDIPIDRTPSIDRQTLSDA